MRFLSLLFPDRCPYCGQIISGKALECEVCRSELIALRLEMTIPSGSRCIAPFSYEGKVRNAILEYKFSSIKFNAESLARRLAEVLSDIAQDTDIVCWVPVSKKRRRERGFDQSELLAVKTARLLGINCACLLKKIKNNETQHRLDKEQRAANVKNVYAAAKPKLIKDKRILLVDDICTTGNTLAECCRVLYSAGARSVLCAAAAITPTPDKKRNDNDDII